MTVTGAPPATSRTPAGEPAMINISVDGQAVLAHPGELIIAAAERAGVFIPRFCYHPRMKPVGMCRMCLVEVVGPRGPSLTPACFVEVAEGQQILTTTSAVRKAQDGVLEFLLVNHPLDCPVCDKGGECPLQDQTIAYGPGETRFVEEKRHFEKPIPISDLVYLDRERCIQCARCTRFAEEIAGEPLIDFQGRGDELEVNIFAGQPFVSYFSGNTVQICPVGALTAAPYRFHARPWDLEQAESTCTTCAVGCRVVAQSSAGRMVRYLGIDSAPVNQGWLCDKGRFDFEWLNSESRLTNPLMRRDGGVLETVGWTGALREVAVAMRVARQEHGAESVALIGGARLANEDAYAWAKLAKSVLGTDSVDAQLGDGLPAELVLGLPRATIEEACAAKAVVLLAPDLREELPVLFLRLRLAAIEAKVPLVELAPVATSLSQYAASSLSYRPGEAAVAASALVDAAGRAASRAGDEAADGARPAKTAGSGAGAGASSGPAGLAAGDLANAGRVLADAGIAAGGEGIVVVLGRTSVSETAESIADAANVLAAAWPGARFLPVLRRANVHGALDMGLAPGLLPGRVALEDAGEWFGSSDAWGSVPPARGRDCRAILEAAAAGEIEVLVLLGADPLADFPDRDLARRGLEGARFVVAVEALANSSTELADVVLPAAAYGERGGTTTNCEGRVSRLAQKTVAPGVAWSDWMIAAELAFILGSDLGLDNLEGIWEEIERLAPSHRGLTNRVLTSAAARDGMVTPIPEASVGAAGIPVRSAVPAPIDPIATPGIESVETQGSPIRSGAAEPPGAELLDDGPHAAVTATRPARPAPMRHAASAPAGGPPVLDRYSMRLVTRRRLYDAGTLVQACPSLAPLGVADRLLAHPAELERLGVVPGSRVRLRSAKASVVTPIHPDAGVPRGVACVGFNVSVGGAGTGDGGAAADLVDVAAPVVDIRVETV